MTLDALQGKVKATDVPADLRTMLQFRAWVKLTRCGDWWVYLQQPGPVVDALFEIEAIAASLGPQLPGED